MGTFDSLLHERRLVRVTLPLKRGEFHERRFYAYPECVEWMRNDVPKMVTGRIASPLTPAEQLVQILRQWMVGDPMDLDRRFKQMRPLSDAVCEMKTHDLRMFGWIYQPCAFVAVRGGYADDYKEPTITKFYRDDVKAVVAARNALPLDGKKFVTGELHELV